MRNFHKTDGALLLGAPAWSPTVMMRTMHELPRSVTGEGLDRTPKKADTLLQGLKNWRGYTPGFKMRQVQGEGLTHHGHPHNLYQGQTVKSLLTCIIYGCFASFSSIGSLGQRRKYGSTAQVWGDYTALTFSHGSRRMYRQVSRINQTCSLSPLKNVSKNFNSKSLSAITQSVLFTERK